MVELDWIVSLSTCLCHTASSFHLFTVYPPPPNPSPLLPYLPYLTGPLLFFHILSSRTSDGRSYFFTLLFTHPVSSYFPSSHPGLFPCLVGLCLEGAVRFHVDHNAS